MHTDHSHFPSLPCLASTLVPTPQKRSRKYKQTKSPMSPTCIVHVLTGACSNSSQPLTQNWVFLTAPCQKLSAVQSYTSALLSQFLRVLFDGFLPRLLLCRGVWKGLSPKPYVPFLDCEVAIIDANAKLASWPFTISRSMDRGLPCGLHRQHLSRTSAWSPVAI